ncbi:MAG TPA: iron ABC transporter permease [Casimicrobiaceae bacterium]
MLPNAGSASQPAAARGACIIAPVNAGGTTGRFAATAVVLAGLAFLALGAGRYPLPFGDVVAALWHHGEGAGNDSAAQAIVWGLRLPRVAVAMLTGSALAAAGAAYQHLFRNPLVAPDTLGVSSGAALGAIIAILLGAGSAGVALAAFAGGIVAVAAVLLIASRLTAHDPLVTLILTGIVVASLLGAGLSLLKYVADPYNELPAITFWLMGSFASASGRQLAVLAPLVAIGLATLFALAWRIDLLALPDDQARSLGLPAARLRVVVIGAATLVTAASVAVGGIIGWVGLVVPHMARLVVGPSFPRLLPQAAVLGAGFVLIVDTAARSVAPIEIPPGILTAIVGTPVFIALLARARHVY